MIAKAVAEERWLMDGSGKSSLDIRLPRTDVVVWLQLPRWQCLVRVLWRVMRYWGRSRPDMADDCPERLDLEFLRYIWTFDREQSPKIRANLQKYGADVPVFILRTSAEVAALLDAISLDVKTDATV